MLYKSKTFELLELLDIVGMFLCAPSAIVKDNFVKFSKNCGTFTIKKSGGGESIINGCLNSKIIITNCQNSSGKSRKFSRSRMTKRTAPLSSSRKI